jgi:antitoxin MazE
MFKTFGQVLIAGVATLLQSDVDLTYEIDVITMLLLASGGGSMRSRVIKIGNSQGLRIPKPILEQTGITDDVEIEVGKNQIIIRPVQNVREGWDNAFKRMGERGDDEPLIHEVDISNSWDEREWQW